MIENLPEPFLTGMMMSNLWKEEGEAEPSVTSCLSLYMPKTVNGDAVAVFRIGFRHGWNLFNTLGFFEGDGTPEAVN